MRKWHITWFLNNKHLSWVLKRTVSPFRWDGSFEHPKHMFELESHSKHPLILSASCKKLETWQLPVSSEDVNIYIMYMRGTSHVSGSPVLLFFCWWYSLLESHWICGSNEFSNYGYVSVDKRKKRKDGLNIVTYTAHARIQNVLSEGVQLWQRFFSWWEDQNTTISGPSSARQRNAI